MTGPETGKQRARDGWLAKNVKPILYDKRGAHVLLADTLKEWARIREDPFHARARIAINEITKMPAGSDDPVVERVTWALQDPVAAKALADEMPIVDEGDFSKLERWLEMFEEKGLLSCVPAAQATAGQGPQVLRLVDNGFQSVNLTTWISLGYILRAGWLVMCMSHSYLRGWFEKVAIFTQGFGMSFREIWPTRTRTFLRDFGCSGASCWRKNRTTTGRTFGLPNNT